MKLLIETNVILDIICNRKGCEAAINLFKRAEQDIMEAFEKGWKDFEDCVQVTIAQNNKMDYIITNNKKDYVNSSLPVLSPQEYLMKK